MTLRTAIENPAAVLSDAATARRQSEARCAKYIADNFTELQKDSMRQALKAFGGVLVTPEGEIRR